MIAENGKNDIVNDWRRQRVKFSAATENPTRSVRNLSILTIQCVGGARKTFKPC